MKILVCGNPLVEKDAAAMKVAELLKNKVSGVQFEEFDSAEELRGDKVFILDVVKGLKKPKVIKNIDDIASEKIYSMHDFDLGQSLKLLKKVGLVKNVTVFGVPEKIGKKTVEKIAEMINLTKASENKQKSNIQ